MEEARSIKVGFAQICSFDNIKDSIKEHKHYINKARREKIECLVFPELSLHSHGAGEKAFEIAINPDSDILKEISLLAKDMFLVVGFVERGKPGIYYNSSAMLHQGEVIHIHRKIFLATYDILDDGKYYKKGTEIAVIEHPVKKDWEFSILICADAWNPSLVYNLCSLHPSILLLPISSCRNLKYANNREAWLLSVKYSSMIYGLPIVCCNRVGEEKEMSFFGGSMISSASGEVLIKAGEEPCLMSTIINFNQIERARTLLPTMREIDMNKIEVNRIICKANK